MRKGLLFTLLALLFIGGGSYFAIQFAKGYRPNIRDKKIEANGLLVANSFPNGASVFLNDKLTTATDTTLHFPPGDYLVRIIKDGYIPWEKNLKIKKELVTQTNAELFKNAPDLQSLTSTGAINPLPSPDGLKLAFVVASSSAQRKNGLWFFDMQQRTLSFSSSLRQIAPQSDKYDFTQAGLFWTPDSKQILAVMGKNNILFDINTTYSIDQFKDVTAQLPILIKEWENMVWQKKQEQLAKIPKDLQMIATASADLVFFSPDEKKMLYTATASATLKEKLIPPLPATSTQTEERELKPNRVYVYDLVEDKNFTLGEALKPDPKTISNNQKYLPKRVIKLQQQYYPLYFENFQWYPTSRHLILIEEGKIKMVEYDGTNKAAVYNGPFVDSFVYPWPEGNKLLILTNLNEETPNISNLYAVGIK